MRRRKPATPPSRPRRIHWLTAPEVTPSAAAISRCDQPYCWSSHARRRRPSRQSEGRAVVVVTILSPQQCSCQAYQSAQRLVDDDSRPRSHAAKPALGSDRCPAWPCSSRLVPTSGRGCPSTSSR
jgi:hypothetical protein